MSHLSWNDRWLKSCLAFKTIQSVGVIDSIFYVDNPIIMDFFTVSRLIWQRPRNELESETGISVLWWWRLRPLDHRSWRQALKGNQIKTYQEYLLGRTFHLFRITLSIMKIKKIGDKLVGTEKVLKKFWRHKVLVQLGTH